MKKRFAFTLIELLIVVAIIAILAAIAVPNFLEAQTRSKVSRTRADMRSVAVAIESYAVDHSKYPWPSRAPNPGFALPTGGYIGSVYLAGMTTPLSYLTSLPKDPFGGKKMADDPYHGAGFNTTFEYWYWTEAYTKVQTGWGGPDWWNAPPPTGGPGFSSNGAKWMLMSQGPDLHWSHIVANPPTNFTNVAEVDNPNQWAYDSTNGTLSWGNIIRFGP